MTRTVAHFFEGITIILAFFTLATWVAEKLEKRYRKEERKKWSTGKGAIR